MDAKVLGGLGILVLLAMAVAGVFTAHNSIANPASPIEAPEISFSSGNSSQAAVEVDMTELNRQAEVILASVPDSSLTLRLEKETETSGEVTDTSTNAKVKWTLAVRNGRCSGGLNTTHKIFRNGNWEDIEIEENLNHTSPDNSPFACNEWDITVMFARWLQRAIESKVGITEILFVIKTAYDNIASKFNLALNAEEFLQLLNLPYK